VYFRRVPVGQVVAYQLDKSGSNVDITVFINSPYDRFVTADSRFWHASGIDLSISANGLKVNTNRSAPSCWVGWRSKPVRPV
jgi:paraquat-inducible protein B